MAQSFAGIHELEIFTLAHIIRAHAFSRQVSGRWLLDNTFSIWRDDAQFALFATVRGEGWISVMFVMISR